MTTWPALSPLREGALVIPLLYSQATRSERRLDQLATKPALRLPYPTEEFLGEQQKRQVSLPSSLDDKN